MKFFRLSIFLLFNISIFTTSCSQEIGKKITLGMDYVYWDAKIGYSWYINKDGTALWYQNINNERYLADFEDVIIECFKWKINHDTIFFYADNATKYTAKYNILSINDSIMRVRDLGKYPSSKENMIFKFSNNQSLKPKTVREDEIYELDSLDRLQQIYPVKK